MPTEFRKKRLEENENVTLETDEEIEYNNDSTDDKKAPKNNIKSKLLFLFILVLIIVFFNFYL
ncbi:MAG: hypothetical protein LBQ24_03765 [Candidatus Peribacteria bacterium]|jgi:hypothetical protein|nr:hypothetical protein [Candidatus Peribacteria bacterium]